MTRRQRDGLEVVILLIVIFISCGVSHRDEDLRNHIPGTPVVEANR
jgi:hypothetical protein